MLIIKGAWELQYFCRLLDTRQTECLSPKPYQRNSSQYLRNPAVSHSIGWLLPLQMESCLSDWMQIWIQYWWQVHAREMVHFPAYMFILSHFSCWNMRDNILEPLRRHPQNTAYWRNNEKTFPKYNIVKEQWRDISKQNNHHQRIMRQQLWKQKQ